MKLFLQALGLITRRMVIILASLSVLGMTCAGLYKVVDTFPVASFCVAVALMLCCWVALAMVEINSKEKSHEIYETWQKTRGGADE